MLALILTALLSAQLHAGACAEFDDLEIAYDNRMLAVAGGFEKGEPAQVYDLTGKKPKRSHEWLEPGWNMVSVAMHPDSRAVAYGELDQGTRVIDLATGAVIHEDSSYYRAMAYSFDGARFAGVGAHTIDILDPGNGYEQVEYGSVDDVYLERVQFTHQARFVIVSGEGPQVDGGKASAVLVFDAATGEEVARVTVLGFVRAMVATPTGRVWVASGRHLLRIDITEDGVATLTPEPVFTADKEIVDLSTSLTGRTIALALGGGMLALVDDSGAVLEHIDGKKDIVDEVAISHDGTLLVWTGCDGKLSSRKLD